MLAVAGLFLIFVIWNAELIIYGIGQAYGQIKIIMQARPVEEILRDDTVNDEIKEKLKLVNKIKAWAIIELGLNPTRNYTTMYDQKGKPVLWVVRACDPFRLSNKEWHFPVIGTVSYKGFFNVKKAIKLRDQLKEEGYDTYLREVDAWSTLGWFKDPIMSEMLRDTPGDMANTVIHELTHATIFVKDSLTFNENLASFIGDKGAETFLTSIYGDASALLQDYIDAKRDRQRYSDHFILGAQKLDSLYASFSDGSTETYKINKKMQMIRMIVDALDTVSFNNSDFKRKFEKQLPNNAYFMSFLLYRSEQSDLNAILNKNFGGNLVEMISSMKRKYPQN